MLRLERLWVTDSAAELSEISAHDTADRAGWHEGHRFDKAFNSASCFWSSANFCKACWGSRSGCWSIVGGHLGRVWGCHFEILEPIRLRSSYESLAVCAWSTCTLTWHLHCCACYDPPPNPISLKVCQSKLKQQRGTHQKDNIAPSFSRIKNPRAGILYDVTGP